MEDWSLLSVGFAAVSAVPARFALATLFGNALCTRIEIANAFNSLRGIREASSLAALRVAPYAGSAVKSPPLLNLALANLPSETHTPFVVADVLSAVLIYLIARQCLPRHQLSSVSTPATASLLFLWNPLAMLSSAGSSSATFVITLALATILSCCSQAPLLAAASAALATYLDPSYSLLVAAAALLLTSGPEDLTSVPSRQKLMQAHTAAAIHSSGTPTENEQCDRNPAELTAQPETEATAPAAVSAAPVTEAAALRAQVPDAAGQPGSSSCPSSQDAGTCGVRSRRVSWSLALQFAGWYILGLLALLLLSDRSLQQWQLHRCLEWLPVGMGGLAGARGVEFVQRSREVVCSLFGMPRHSGTSSAADLAGYLVDTRPESPSWFRQVYGAWLLYEDLAPNIGLWWYFLVEIFEEFRPFYTFIMHASNVIFVLPVAVRFFHRPMFAVFLQSLLIATFKPYPVIADFLVPLSLLPLFSLQLRRVQGLVLVGALMALVAVLEPATYYQWIYTGSANSNFYYAVTLVWGSAHVIVMLAVVHATLEYDRLLIGKPLQFFLAKSGNP